MAGTTIALTGVGVGVLANRVIQAGTAPKNIGWGIGTTPAAVTDTALQSEAAPTTSGGRTVGAESRTTSVVTFATNSTTAAGNNTLHFASVPINVVPPQVIVDTTTGGVIPGGTTVVSTTTTTVVMSANATAGGVNTGDTITFQLANDTYQVAGTVTAVSTLAITEAGLFDAVSAGNMPIHATFNAVNVNSGDSIAFTFDTQFLPGITTA